jgi:hypothetical protein
MAADTLDRMRLLYGRDAYQGTTPPSVCEVRAYAELVEIRAAGRAALVLVREGTDVHLIRATRCDEPGLEVLSPSDRARVAAAVATLNRDGGPPDAA